MLDFLAAGTAASGPPGWTTFLPIIGMVAIFWFLLIRPQMRQQKAHREKIAGVKKGDQVVTAGGLLGKVIKVDDHYAEIEIARHGKRFRFIDRNGLEITADHHRPMPDIE